MPQEALSTVMSATITARNPNMNMSQPHVSFAVLCVPLCSVNLSLAVSSPRPAVEGAVESLLTDCLSIELKQPLRVCGPWILTRDSSSVLYPSSLGRRPRGWPPGVQALH